MEDQNKFDERIQDLVQEAEEKPAHPVKKEKPKLKESIYSLRPDELQEWLKANGEKPFRAAQIFEWLYSKRVKTFDEMSNLSKGLRDKLEENFALTTLSTLVKQESKDGTIKFLFQLQDGYSIETVLMRHEYGNSICVTTQVGCRIGCTFCASTLGGLKRHLMAGEIVEQVVKVQQKLDETGERVSSIVIMGIGEPFDNYEAMMNFLKIVNDDKGLNIGARHITVSTSGIVPKIYQFADEQMQINFAVSLHAPNQEARQKLMPIARAYKIDELLEAVRYYTKKTGRRVTFEYGLMSGENDSVEIAEELSALIKDIKCHVNLIPINYVPERDYIRTSRSKIFAFEKTLKKNGINVTIRREQGADIAAACGQLRAAERSEEIK
ncbi:23S rRNA (adenine(2503)-C(2))-methyltransferase RlmN [Lysinibacillus sp. 54212]|uniref:23S rRNA (adenine(2503)-C(2))-methyltransferase RlmN n=1 Tax=Lysinibacillus sp. 54212 TaxID=3119829 RepID=UPI002FC82258